jgi:hypothetical protein
MLLLERAPEQETISSDEGSRLNGTLCELLSLSELSYIHLHGDKKDLLLLGINETFGLVIASTRSLAWAGFCTMLGAVPWLWDKF